MGSAVAEFGVPSAGIGTYRSLGPQILHIFAVSPIHLHQLRAGRRATLRVVAFRRQELLFDLTLSLTGSHTFHTVSRSLQSVSINFELDVGLHFVSWLSVGRGSCLISPDPLPGPQILHDFFLRLLVLSSIPLNQHGARRRATLRVVGFPSAGVLFDLAPSLTNSHSFSIAFRMLLRSLQSISINFELDVGLHLLSWLLVFGSCLISPYHSTSLPVSHHFSHVLSIANYMAVESSPYITPCRASYLSYISPSVFTVYISAKPTSIVRFHSTQYSTKNGLRHQQSSA